MGILKVTRSKGGVVLNEKETDLTEKRGGKVANRKTGKKKPKSKEPSS